MRKLVGTDKFEPASLISRRNALQLFALTGLAACTPTSNPLPPSNTPLLPGPPLVAAGGDVLGTGSVSVGLLLPRTGPNNAGALSQAMRNAAELGLNDFTANDIRILIKDTAGTPEGAIAAAQAAVTEGAELILGPIFAAEARAVTQVAITSNRPVISFSSDPSVATPQVLIMGFLVDDQVTQLVNHAASSGRKSMAAVVPDSAYGTLAEAALRQATSSRGIRLTQVERYAAGAHAASATAVAANAAQIDCVFVPDGSAIAPQIAESLKAGGVDFGRVMLLGSGQWNDPTVYSSPSLAGGRFPAPELTGFQNFAARYRTAFASDPPLTASLAYDAVVLAAGLVKLAGPQRFSPQVLTNPQGFLSSVNGLFRFNANGSNDRGLAIYEVSGAVPKLIQPAPRSFGSA